MATMWSVLHFTHGTNTHDCTGGGEEVDATHVTLVGVYDSKERAHGVVAASDKGGAFYVFASEVNQDVWAPEDEGEALVTANQQEASVRFKASMLVKEKEKQKQREQNAAAARDAAARDAAYISNLTTRFARTGLEARVDPVSPCQMGMLLSLLERLDVATDIITRCQSPISTCGVIRAVLEESMHDEELKGLLDQVYDAAGRTLRSLIADALTGLDRVAEDERQRDEQWTAARAEAVAEGIEDRARVQGDDLAARFSREGLYVWGDAIPYAQVATALTLKVHLDATRAGAGGWCTTAPAIQVSLAESLREAETNTDHAAMLDRVTDGDGRTLRTLITDALTHIATHSMTGNTWGV